MPKRFTSEVTKQPKKVCIDAKKIYIFDEKVYVIYKKTAKTFI
jgi:hypothetical protein